LGLLTGFILLGLIVRLRWIVLAAVGVVLLTALLTSNTPLPTRHWVLCGLAALA
jgi:hypothetical protein